MKKIGLAAVCVEKSGDILGHSTGADINNAALTGFPEKLFQSVMFILAPQNAKGDVRSRKGIFYDQWLGKTKIINDVSGYPIRSGRGKGDYRRFGKEFPKFGAFQISGPKIMAPLRDTMCLVDGDEVDVHLPYFILYHLLLQAFGGKIYELVATVQAIIQQRNKLIERLSLIHISEPTRRTPISYA